MPAQPVQKADRPGKDWYSVSVETLQSWGLLLLILGLVALGVLLYRRYDRDSLQREAGAVIDQAEALRAAAERREAGGDELRLRVRVGPPEPRRGPGQADGAGLRRRPRRAAGAAATCCSRSSTRWRCAAAPARRSSPPSRARSSTGAATAATGRRRAAASSSSPATPCARRTTARPRSCSRTARSTRCGRTPSSSSRRGAPAPGAAPSSRSR